MNRVLGVVPVRCGTCRKVYAGGRPHACTRGPLDTMVTYIGKCCREWILALGMPPGRCGLCGETPWYLCPDHRNSGLVAA